MILYKKAENLSKYIVAKKEEGKSIGFVPTMGALHNGHLSLIENSNQQCDITVCSIFVNPTQFNDQKDFENYPVTVARDLQLLESKQCDVVFLPSVEQMYPRGLKQVKQYNLAPLDGLLEGKFRPGHFQGVCQVVERLLTIVKPHKLFLGQKDYQQCMVIQKLVEQIELPIEIIKTNTLRESSGLAMSSRNSRLNNEEKVTAAFIYKALLNIKKQYNVLPARALEENTIAYLLNNGFTKVDYVSIADATTLSAVSDDNHKNAVALVAAFIGTVRLIDNMVLTG
jgi:pantoate--beta-alanine ligase